MPLATDTQDCAATRCAPSGGESPEAGEAEGTASGSSSRPRRPRRFGKSRRDLWPTDLESTGGHWAVDDRGIQVWYPGFD